MTARNPTGTRICVQERCSANVVSACVVETENAQVDGTRNDAWHVRRGGQPDGV